MQNHKLVYLDNAATGMPKPEPVIAAVVNALRTAGNAGRGITAPAMAAAGLIYDCRTELADFFGAKSPERMILTSNITESLNLVLHGLLEPGDHVLTDVSQHNSVLRPLHILARERGIDLEIIPCDGKGRVDPGEYRKRVRPQTKAIVCQHASNLTGNVFALEDFCAIARETGVKLVVDTAQSAGLLPIDLSRLPIDFLCFTGHKGLHGPQGTGGFYVRDGVELAAVKAGGTGVDSYNLYQPDVYPEHLEAGTLNSPGIAGLGAAVRWVKEQDPAKLYERAMALANRFLEGVREFAGVELLGDYDAAIRMPIVTLNMPGIESGDLSDRLGFAYNIQTRAGAHCTPLLHEALGTDKRGAVRFSFAASNTEEEVDYALAALHEICD